MFQRVKKEKYGGVVKMVIPTLQESTIVVA
jgi:hypothetical protein